MALRKSIQAAMRVPALSALVAAAPVPLVAEFTTIAGVVVGDIIEMGALPAGMLLRDLTVVCDDLDSSATTMTADVGLMSGQYLAALDDAGAARTCGAEFLSAAALGQASGGVFTSALKAGLQLAPSASDRSIGVKLTGTLGTLVVGAKIRLYATFVPVPPGIAFA